jgi:hypothetical protein
MPRSNTSWLFFANDLNPLSVIFFRYKPDKPCRIIN